ncbi:MAG: LysM domain-containing protein, partial [Chloroflexi bacterium]|nr:LysM domain-containing protein [Chloroflexota bacterium]
MLNLRHKYFLASCAALVTAGCVTAQAAIPQPASNVLPATATAEPTATTPAPTAVPTLPPPTPTVAVPVENAANNFYRSQPGDTVPALAGRFGVSEGDLRASNPTLPMTGVLVAPGSKLLVSMFDFGLEPQL